MSTSTTLPTSLTRILTAPDEKLQNAVAYVEHCLKEIHGGEWKIAVDHEQKFVLIVPRPGGRGDTE